MVAEGPQPMSLAFSLPRSVIVLRIAASTPMGGCDVPSLVIGMLVNGVGILVALRYGEGREPSVDGGTPLFSCRQHFLLNGFFVKDFLLGFLKEMNYLFFVVYFGHVDGIKRRLILGE
jgi:hypothetical protein